MRKLFVAPIAAAALLASGCGTESRTQSKPFAWLSAHPAPANWTSQRLGVAGTLPKPPGWRTIHGDPGSVSFARLGAGGQIVGYLNATPATATETQATWARFRPDHNADEGDMAVRTAAGVTGEHVGGSQVSCVQDAYRTTRSTYQEIACLVNRSAGRVVLVGAATPADWRQESPLLERALAGFLAS